MVVVKDLKLQASVDLTNFHGISDKVLQVIEMRCTKAVNARLLINKILQEMGMELDLIIVVIVKKIFDRLCALNLHHKSCFGENLGIDLYPFSCEFCDQSYKTFDGLEKHEKRIHQSKTKAGKYVKRDAMKRKPQCKKNQMITDEAAFQAFLSNIERERIVAELELRMQMKKYDIL